ncbi:MAG: phytanoyl-CoA dioxygenase family protein [Alphaproteobacteria bacterium]
MAKRLSPDDIQRFEADGFCGPFQVLDTREVAHYRARLEGFERAHPAECRKLKTKAHLLCPWVDALARHPRILDPFEDLLGPDLLCYSMAFRVKEPGSRTVAGWHQDTAYSQLRPVLVIAALALSECGPEQGCLSVLPGTHKGPILPHAESSGEDSILARGQSIGAQLDTGNAVDLALRPGQMSLFHFNIVHGSRANVSRDRRLMLLVEMMPASAYQAQGREAAMLVRGKDRYGNFELDQPPRTEFGQVEIESWQRSVSIRAKVIFSDSVLPVSEAYGGVKRTG